MRRRLLQFIASPPSSPNPLPAGPLLRRSRASLCPAAPPRRTSASFKTRAPGHVDFAGALRPLARVDRAWVSSCLAKAQCPPRPPFLLASLCTERARPNVSSPFQLLSCTLRPARFSLLTFFQICDFANLTRDLQICRKVPLDHAFHIS